MSGRARASRHLIALMVVAATAAACGDSPTAPPPVGPAVMCPADETVQSANGNPVPVVFPTVTSTGGTPPVSIVCAPQSGSVFSVGTSKVTCVATDAAHLTSSCSFAVTVQSVAVPHLAMTRFVAFGDSITEGKLGDGTLVGSASYPATLEVMLKARYTTQAQSISVKNEGCSGEKAVAGGTCGGGVVRLPGVLAADNPQALLLLEGANDLFGGDPAAVTPLIDALRTMVRQAKSRGVVVFLSTLTPVRQNGTPPRGNGGFFLTPPTNDQIKLVAASEGAVLVDSFVGFGGSPDPFIGPDGLHPTLAGYQQLAQIFFGSIKSTLEGAAGLGP